MPSPCVGVGVDCALGVDHSGRLQLPGSFKLLAMDEKESAPFQHTFKEVTIYQLSCLESINRKDGGVKQQYRFPPLGAVFSSAISSTLARSIWMPLLASTFITVSAIS